MTLNLENLVIDPEIAAKYMEILEYIDDPDLLFALELTIKEKDSEITIDRVIFENVLANWRSFKGRNCLNFENATGFFHTHPHTCTTLLAALDLLGIIPATEMRKITERLILEAREDRRMRREQLTAEQRKANATRAKFDY